MFCIKCGATNPDETIFCMRCGNKMPQMQDPVQQTVQQPVQNYASVDKFTDTHVAPVATKSKKKIIAALIAVILIASAVTAYFLLFAGKNSGKSPEDPLNTHFEAINKADMDMLLSTLPPEAANKIKNTPWKIYSLKGTLLQTKAYWMRLLEDKDITEDGDFVIKVNYKTYMDSEDVEAAQNRYRKIMEEEYDIDSDAEFTAGCKLTSSLVFQYSGGEEKLGKPDTIEAYKINGKWYIIDLL